MKRLFLTVIAVCFLAGCASSQVATRIGVKIGEGYQSSAEKGLPSADTIKAWPYVSGQIKGIYAQNYELEVPFVMQRIITNLDTLAAKDKLTDEERGMVIGYYVRLEALAAEYGWSKYGADIYKMIVKLIGG